MKFYNIDRKEKKKEESFCVTQFLTQSVIANIIRRSYDKTFVYIEGRNIYIKIIRYKILGHMRRISLSLSHFEALIEFSDC